MQTAIINRELIEAIDSPLALQFETIEKESYDTKFKKARVLGLITYSTDEIFVIKNNNKLIVCSFLNFEIIDAVELFKYTEFTSIDLRGVDTSNVTNMNEMFFKCKATSLNISNFDTSNVTYMSGMFNGCQATSLDLSSFDTSNVVEMIEMFWGCQATSIKLPQGYIIKDGELQKE